MNLDVSSISTKSFQPPMNDDGDDGDPDDRGERQAPTSARSCHEVRAHGSHQRLEVRLVLELDRVAAARTARR